jgi:hypothetical protein
MNSALQCLSHTKGLTKYFLTHDNEKQVNPLNKFGSGGEVSNSYGDLMHKLWNGNKEIAKPIEFKESIAKVNSLYQGYNQHDSFECIINILDILNEDLNKVNKKPYRSSFPTEGKPLDELSSDQWEYFLSRNDSPITQFFHFQFHTSQTCEECKQPMHYFEESNTLSLHLPSSPISSAPTGSTFYSSSKSSLTIIVHPHTFRAGKGVRRIEVECDGQMKLGQLVKKITDRKVEMFEIKNENLKKVKQSSKTKHLDGKTIECFEISQQGEEYVNLKFKVFNATKKPAPKWTTHWINVTVRNDAENLRIYYKIFRHLFGISNYAENQSDDDLGKNRLYTLFYESFTRKDKKLPFFLELICPPICKCCGIRRSNLKYCILDINSSLTLKEIIESNKGKLPDFKLFYIQEDEFSFSKLNSKTEEPLNLYVPRAKPQRSGPLSINHLMDDFFSVSYLDAESQAK